MARILLDQGQVRRIPDPHWSSDDDRLSLDFTVTLSCSLQEHSVETPHGVLHVTLHGTRTTRRPAILTFHDVGLDSESLLLGPVRILLTCRSFTTCPLSSCPAGKSCFSHLFKFEEMQEIVKNFTLIHIDAPGQEEGAAGYPAGYDT